MAASPEQQPSGGSMEGEFAAETDKMRAAAIERIMDNGFPQSGDPDEGDPNGPVYQPDLYSKVWEQADSYVAAVRKDVQLDETLHEYLQNPQNAKALYGVMDQLKAGKAPNDLLAAEEAGPPSRRHLAAFIAFENVVKGAVRSEGGQRIAGQNQRRESDLLGPQGEAARRLTRVAEIMDIESNALMIERGLNPLDGEQATEDYAATFNAFAQRPDVPDIYRERAREMASKLRIDAMKQEKPLVAAKKITIEDIAPVSREQVKSTRLEGVGIAVKLEHDPSHKLFGKENPLKADDLRQIQEKIEALTRDLNPKNAFEVAKLAAHMKRAGVRIVEGHEQLGSYVQRQRLKMQEYGPRALAQYLTYSKYAGFVNELSEQEHNWLMASIQDRIRNDQTHKGLTRLAMNARYLGVSHYTPDLVREGVLKEIEALKMAGRTEDAAAEAARARLAGVDPSAVFTTAGGFAGNLKEKLAEHASAGRWDFYARLRNNLDVAWKHLPLLDKQISGLIGHFTAARERAQKNGQWDVYADYAAHIRELSNREGKRQRGESVAPVTPAPRPRSIGERARLTPSEYEAYLGGPEPARAAQEEVPAEAAAEPVETPVFQETPPEPVVTGGWFRRFWSLFRRREQRPSDQETPTNTAA